MKGKPKGIRRKDAGNETDPQRKIEITFLGDILDIPEREKYGEVSSFWEDLLKGLPDKDADGNTLITGRQKKTEVARIRKEWAEKVIDAIVSDDVEFFERMAALARYNRAGRPVADPMGTQVLIAARLMQANGITPSSGLIADFLTKRSGNQVAWEASTVRRIIRQLGGIP